MQLHLLRPQHKRKQRQRCGRGGKRGTYCGRGIKGQNARSGARKQPIIRELIKRYPKIRGYKNNPQRRSLLALVNVSDLEKNFQKGNVVSPKTLIAQKIIDKIKGRIPKVKILGRGDIRRSLIIKNCQVSKTAKEKIERAGGKVEVVP